MSENNIDAAVQNQNENEISIPHVNVIKMPVGDLMRKNYLNYAVSVIMDRALPDVRDGLKPVHRRILFSMHELKMFPSSKHMKSARLVGEVMGKYHPHGDSSIYEAAVYMTQPWSKRVPLIDGQGNFGSIDGDPAAAMRYCFAAGTRIMTSKGLLKIEDLVSKDELTSALKQPNQHSYVPLNLELESLKGAKLASKWIYSGVQDTVKILTTNGYEAICTPNEPFLVLNEKLEYVWVDVKDLKAGDKVCMLGKPAQVNIQSGKELNITHKIVKNMDNEFAELMGMMLASVKFLDANMIFNIKTSQFSKFKEMFIKLIAKDEQGLLQGHSAISNSVDVQQIYVPTNSPFYDFLIEVLFDSKVNGFSFIPEFIYNCSIEEISQFLKGYFAINANVIQDKIIIRQDKNNLDLINHIKLIMQSYLGIITTKPINCGDQNNNWQIEVNQSYIARYKKFIDNHIPQNIVLEEYNINNLLETFFTLDEKIKKDINDRDYFYATVESITLELNQAVFDLTVPDTHAFVANGFIVHNTEARLTKAGAAFFEDIDKETVSFRDNYDGRESEPEVLPVSYPNIWINGVEGIAVGMATYLPPHNLNETVDVTLALQKNPDLTIEEILQIMPAPDFPTGGIVHDLDGFRNALLTGKGMVRVRSKWHPETLKNGQELLVIDELPYKVNKLLLIQSIVDKVKAKDSELEEITDINDETTDRDGIRIAISLKKGAIPAVIFNHLVKKTTIESSYNYNVMLLEGQNPKQMGLVEILKRFLTFREEIIVKRISFELRKAKERLHLLDGMMIVLSDLEKAIKIIMDNKDKESANIALRSNFTIDEIQAKNILEMRLHRLTGMEIDTIKKEFEEVSAEVSDMNDSLSKPLRIQEMIKKDLLSAKERFGDDRRSEVSYENNQINMSDLIKEEPCLIHVTKNGYLKRMPLSILEAQNRNGKGRMGIQTGDGDFVEAIYTGSTHDLFMVFTKSGKAMSSRVWNLPDGTTAQRGRHLRNIFESLNEPIANLLLVPEIETGLSVITVTAKGKVKRSALSDYTGTLRRKGVQGVSIDEDDSLVSVLLAKRHDHLILVTSSGKAARFEIDDEALQVRGRKSVGVKGIVVGAGATVIGAMVISSNEQPMPEITVQKTKTVFGEDVIEDVIELDTSAMDEGKYLFCIGENGVGKRTSVSEFTPHSRGTKGVNCFNINDKTGRLVKVALVTNEDDLMMTSVNKTLRIRVSDVRLAGRNTAGTMLMNVGTEKLIDVIKVPREEEVMENTEDSLELLAEELHEENNNDSDNTINNGIDSQDNSSN